LSRWRRQGRGDRFERIADPGSASRMRELDTATYSIPAKLSVRKHAQDDNRQYTCGCQHYRGENSVTKGARIASDCRLARSSSMSRFQLCRNVAQPVTSTANGRASRSTHRVHIHPAYHMTSCCAARAGSYCGGLTLRSARAVMKSRGEGKISASSNAATTRMRIELYNAKLRICP
jgi:hypothetical protein